MTVCITVEHRFDRTPDGAVWTRSNHSYQESRRYLDVFDQVRLLARVRDVAVAPTGSLRADGDGVSFGALPYYVGFAQFCLNARAVRRASLAAIGPTDAIILKAPSPLTCLIEPALYSQRRPYALQVIGDPWGIYSKGSIKHPLRPLLRSVLTRLTASQCRHASAVSYVTQRALQSRYPASPTAFQSAVSDVILPAGAFADTPRSSPGATEPIRIITVAALEQPYKGIDVLLRALSLCAARGLGFHLTVVGDGRLRPLLTALAADLGLNGSVEFRGSLPSGAKVFEALDESNLFILPSRHEGLPRAMLEAMARALPCIGSDTGGIPELLEGFGLVAPGDPEALAARILDVCRNPGLMERMSRSSLDRAQEFKEDILNVRWREFFTQVRDTTARWAAGNSVEPEASLSGSATSLAKTESCR